MRKIGYFTAGFVLALILIPVPGSAQKDPEKEERKPEIKWDVQKHYDENGNLFLFDSSYSWSWSNHNFDSILHSFMLPEDFPDSIFTMPFGHSSFPDVLFDLPDFKGFEDLLPFPDSGDMFERFREMFERFYNMNPFPYDSLYHFKYKQQYQQEDQKKTWREHEI